MPVDRYNACPACPQPVRDLYLAARLLVVRLQEQAPVDTIAALVDCELRVAVLQLQPFIDAHSGNQEHALSEDLAGIRHPEAPR